ncbi:glycosyltransferase [Streptomyces purpurascens]
MSEDTLAEDTDITIAMHRAGRRVVYQENARAWTEAPGSLKQLWSQRYRWSYGTMQATVEAPQVPHGQAGTSGRFGRVGMPLVVDVPDRHAGASPRSSTCSRPYSMIFVPTSKAALLAWLAVSSGSSWSARRTPSAWTSESTAHLLMMPLQQLAYRQMMYLVLIHSCVTALTGGRLRWQKLKRTGEVGTPAGAG